MSDAIPYLVWRQLLGNNRKRERQGVAQRAKKPILQKTKYRRPSINIGTLLVILLFALVIVVCLLGGRGGNDENGVPSVTDTVTGEAEGGEAESGKDTVSVQAHDIHKGNLILVNAEHEFVFAARDDISVYENKTSSYKVNDKNVTLSPVAIEPLNRLMDDFYAQTECRDVMVVSGFRTEEFQRELYNERVKTQGVEAAAAYVALPGFSEHHTGLAMDLSVYTSAGEGYYVKEYPLCAWLIDNFEKYGFILRYPESKADITGISYESWHYRYVGLPHSLIMKSLDFCFEEYIDYLEGLKGRAVVWNGTEAEEVTDGGQYVKHDGYSVIKYIPKNADGGVEISLPSWAKYDISGDNVGGYIVTVYDADVIRTAKQN